MASLEKEVSPTFRDIYFDRYDSGNGINWDIGRPQSSIVRLVESNFFSGRVLDVGCGLGDNARCIAEQKNFETALEVVAIDLVPKAIEMAIERTDTQKYSNLIYKVVDVLKPTIASELGQFDFIIESCLFHALPDEERIVYMNNLRDLLKSDGYLVQLVASEKEDRERSGGPRKVARHEIEQIFSAKNGWCIESIQDDIIDTVQNLFNGRAIAYLSIIRRL